MEPPRPDLSMTRPEAFSFLARHRQAALATNGPDGWPHVVAVTYVLTEGKLATTSRLRSQKVANLRRDPRVTVMVDDGHDHASRRGLIVFGTGELVSDAEQVQQVIRSILATDPRGEDALPVAVERMARNRTAVYVTPARLASWDHTRIRPGWATPL
jgi:PPOX class probable F420-dependent enzyme